MSNFHDITMTEFEMFYEEGKKAGVLLKEKQELFLRQTTLQKIMTSKKKQKEYQELFKY
jgi:hypothetical protein